LSCCPDRGYYFHKGIQVALLFYFRLIGLTAGTLVYLFIIALILGHRRPRRFERLLFFLILSMFLIYAGGLLEINAQIQYGFPPQATVWLYTGLMVLGTLLLQPLVWHTHLEYARSIERTRVPTLFWVVAGLLYAGAIGEAVFVWMVSHRVGGTVAAAMLAHGKYRLLIYWAACAGLAAVAQIWVTLRETNRNAKILGRWLISLSCVLFAALAVRTAYMAASPFLADLLTTVIMVAAVLPGALLIYYALQHNFLEIGAQRNLVYALSATFLALLYLALVHRVSGWLEPVLPPEATSSILVFLLIFLFEPLERAIGPALHRRFRERIERWQRLATELQEQARHGDLARFVRFAEQQIREEFGLASARISAPRDANAKPLESPGGLGHAVRIPLIKDGREIGLLEAASTGSYLTGETSAGLQFLAEQLPAMLDLCALIDEKLRLERELAERERLAVLGQMAASVSHNLRNPLSSMKIVLQVLLENRRLSADVRHDCELVVAELDRMSVKLKQLLNFAKPAVSEKSVGAVALTKQTAELLRKDAERHTVILEFNAPEEEIPILASEEALSEVLSNLIVNAIEAQPEGGRVKIRLARADGRLEILVEDEGPGVSADLRARMFQPFFTTKVSGTGLGLAIAARRVAEIVGTISCESPLEGGRGTRFRVTLPLAGEASEHAETNADAALDAAKTNAV
jgi:signal transduction histidine kinase